MILRLGTAIVLILVLLFVVRLVLLSSESRKPREPSPVPASLAPCPDRPNCVGSLETDPERRVDPFPIEGSPDEAMERLAARIAEMRGTRVVVNRDGYVHSEYRSRIFGFVDDLELRADPEAGVIHVRSASRTGYSDLGVNRKRVEALRRLAAAAS